MLILTRRPVETIYIGDDITITVLGVVGNQVRLGINAPKEVVIDRAEIHEKKQAAKNGGGEINGNVAAPPPTLKVQRPPGVDSLEHRRKLEGVR